MKHRGDADSGAEMLGIGGDGQHRLRRGLEQEIVDHRLVLLGDVADRRRQREHDVEVGHRQKLGLALRQPLAGCCSLALRAMPVAAGVVGDHRMAAVLAARDMAAERRRAAALDGAHHLELAEAHVAAVGMTPSGPVVAEDVRDLQRGTGHVGRLRRRLVLLLRHSGVSRSSGLMTSRIVLVATWV